MSRSLLIALLIILLRGLNAQWEYLNDGRMAEYTSIDFIDESNGWMTYKNGLLTKTYDGGKNWEGIQLPDLWNLEKIKFVDIPRVVAEVVEDHHAREVETVDDIFAIDRDSRSRTRRLLEQR